MRISRTAALIVCIPLFVTSGIGRLLAGQPQQQQERWHVSDFGEDLGHVVSNGFLFVDGSYVEYPYKVARRGLAIFVNDVLIRESAVEWPPRNVQVSQPPGYPPGLTAKSDFADIHEDYEDPFDAPWHREYRYVHQHFPRRQAYHKMREWFEGLPFVASVQTNRGMSQLLVTTRAGKKRSYDVSLPGEAYGVVAPLTKEIVMRDIEAIRSRYERRLAAGDCFFVFSSGGELSFGAGRAVQILPEIVDTLSSGDKVEKKVAELKHLGLLPPSWTSNGVQIVNGFSGSSQLEARVVDLRNERGRARSKHLSLEQEQMQRSGHGKQKAGERGSP